MMAASDKCYYKAGTLLAFTVPLIYWIYLFFNTQPDVVFDSIGYRDLGRTIYQDGWITYFKEGPGREPFYPFTIAVSMLLGDRFSIPYLDFQKLVQILMFFTTQCLLYVAMKKMAIRPSVRNAVLLYAGLSPALVNSAFSVFSEIASYPLVLGIVLLSTTALVRGRDERPVKMVYIGAGLGILFCLLISTKAIFEYVFLLVCAVWSLMLLYLVFCGKNRMGINLLLSLITSIIIVQGFLYTYKSLNHHYNGNYTFTNRGAWMLYGGIDKRLVPLSTSGFLAATLTITGDGLCPKFFPQAECQHWHYSTSDRLGNEKMMELLSQNVPMSEVDSRLIKLSSERILKQPIQYTMFHVLESLRMIFWESTRIGFVHYPPLLENLFERNVVKIFVRFVNGLITFSAITYCIGYVIRNRRRLLEPSEPQAYRLQMTLLNIIISMAFILLYGFFTILTRYSLPIAPLYLLLIAVFLDSMLKQAPLNPQPQISITALS